MLRAAVGRRTPIGSRRRTYGGGRAGTRRCGVGIARSHRSAGRPERLHPRRVSAHGARPRRLTRSQAGAWRSTLVIEMRVTRARAGAGRDPGRPDARARRGDSGDDTPEVLSSGWRAIVPDRAAGPLLCGQAQARDHRRHGDHRRGGGGHQPGAGGARRRIAGQPRPQGGASLERQESGEDGQEDLCNEEGLGQKGREGTSQGCQAGSPKAARLQDDRRVLQRPPKASGRPKRAPKRPPAGPRLGRSEPGWPRRPARTCRPPKGSRNGEPRPRNG